MKHFDFPTKDDHVLEQGEQAAAVAILFLVNTTQIPDPRAGDSHGSGRVGGGRLSKLPAKLADASHGRRCLSSAGH